MMSLCLHLLSVPDDRFLSLAGFALDPTTVARQAPEAMLLAEHSDGRPRARCSLWWSRTPFLEGKRIGYVGHYAALDSDAGVEILKRACRELAERRCVRAVGPIDGSTWQRYRLITERGSEPPFFLEPDNPDDWPGHFHAAGFEPLARYCSALNTDLTSQEERIPTVTQHLNELGVILRPLNVDRFEDELRHVHALSQLCFSNNFLYTPISEADFVAQYAAVRPHVRPELALLAERHGMLVGYMFSFPELLRAARGQPMDTVILKTVAVHPELRGVGLGSLLMARAHETARALGFTRAIHALFHEDNRSGRISAHTAHIFRHYTLFAKWLAS